MDKSYLEATFPYETQMRGGNKVRLLGVIGNMVIGASYTAYGKGDSYKESSSQALNWNGDGIFADGRYNDMNLLPLPDNLLAEIERLQKDLEEIEGRLANHPNAPQVWRGIDEQALVKAKKAIEDLSKQLPAQEEAE